MTAIEKLIIELQSAAADLEKGYGHNKAAATRARKALQNVRALAQDSRKELLAISKGEEDPKTVSVTGLVTFTLSQGDGDAEG